MDEIKKPTLRELRKQRCVSVTEIAYKVGVSPATLYLWELGKVIPLLPKAIELAQFLGSHVEDIDWRFADA